MFRITSQGFSLFEFMIALSIVIILTIIAVPVFIKVYQEYHVSTATQHLYQVLQYARTSAIQKNQTVYVNFQTGDSWCYGVNPGSSCSCNVANSCTLGSYSATKTQDLTLSTSGLSGGNLTFEGTHGAANITSTITFTQYSGTTALGINVTPFGNLQLCSSTISGYSAC